MRLVARLIIGVAAVLLLTGAGLYLFRKPIAGAAVERVMVGARLENPSAEVTNISLSRLTLSRMTAGASAASPDLSLGPVAFDYDWRDLIFRRKLKSVTIGGGRLVVALSEKGAVTIAGWSPDPNAESAAAPFGSLAVGGLDVIADMPKGPASFNISGAFDLQDGGHFDILIEADEAGFPAATLTRVSGRATVDLGADGAVALAGALKGDLATLAGIATDVDATLDAALSSWRGFFGESQRGFQGAASVAINSSTIDAKSAAALSPLMSAGGVPIRKIALSGTFKASFDADAVSVSLADHPLTVVADRGDRAVISDGDGPAYEKRGDEERLALKAAIEGPVANGTASIKAASANNGPWSIDASARTGEQSIGGVSLSSFDGTFRGAYSDDRADGEAVIATHVKKATIGRLVVADMPASGRLAVNIDVAGKLFTASPADGECLNTDRANFRFAEQDMDARVAAASLCPGAAPLITIRWGDSATTHVEGVLTARTAHYRLGKTVFDGAPPQVDFTLDYAPALQKSRIIGAIAGGKVVLNDALVLTEVKGEFDADLVRDTVAANIALSSMRITQKAELEKVAPVMVAGGARLADNVATFDFDVKTPQGARLGRGEGVHQVATGRGEAIFDSGLLKFSYGFQPDRLIPALRGVISNATGATEGRARFSWAPDEFASSATVDLDNVSFGGPGVAVTRTEGVTGKLVFSALSPIATSGEQMISIRKVDLDALKLENGSARFALPGDDTLEIVEAEFPWFSGTIGAYDSKLSIAGGKSETALQIDNVNLGELLNYLNVEGLSGVGVIEGVLPISFEGGRARVNNGILSSKGPGVVRYQGKASAAAAQSNEQSALAFEILRELRFEKLSATVDGPLDGTLNFKIQFEGRSDIPVKTGRKTQRVDSPVNYRINIEAPLLSLIEQAVLSTDVKLQIERAKQQEAAKKQSQ